MARRQANYWADFKARAALSLISGTRTLQELAARYGVGVERLAEWRRFLEERAGDVFGLAQMRPDSVPEPVGAIEEDIARLEQALRETDAEVARLRQALAASTVEIDRLESELGALAARAAALEGEKTQAQARVRAMESSLSWRLTSPVRMIGAPMFALGRKGAAEREEPAGEPAAVPGPDAPPATSEPASGTAAQAAAEAPPGPVEEPFDPDFYLENYPDVRNYTLGPLAHYLNCGKAEGRLGSIPRIDAVQGLGSLDPARETVLVVCHEGSRTGAPVLGLNLVRLLKRQYNVAVLLLKGGDLTGSFRAAADLLLGPVENEHSEVLPCLHVARLLEATPIKFAIVNSVVSRAVLPELSRHFVPTVSLIHEFAAYTRPREAFVDALFWTTEAVYPAQAVQDDALATVPELAARKGLILRQGRCEVDRPLDPAGALAEAARVREALRPAGWPPETFVVLGVGLVQVRKGVDLFVACASRVIEAMGPRPCRFVWIGDGYDPVRDNAYSSYLEDQVARAALGERFAFAGSTPEIEAAYAAADVLVVSSRLDPLPNVAIDAMVLGLPLVCFDRTGGIAEVLRASDLASDCVAPYLDVEGLAARVLALAGDRIRRRELGSRLKAVADRVFDMGGYAAQIEQAAMRCVRVARQESEDCALIVESPVVDVEFMSARPAARDVAVREFVRSWVAGIRLRKPFPGFHPGVYADRAGGAQGPSNPLAGYLRDGSPEGPWRLPVIRAGAVPAAQAAPGAQAIVHLHVKRLEDVGAAASIARILEAGSPHRIVATTCAEAVAKELEASLESHPKGPWQVKRMSPDCDEWLALLAVARDLGPEGDALVCHLDVGRSARGGSAGEAGESGFVLGNLVGAGSRMMDAILDEFARAPSLGLVFPDDPNVVGWSESRNHAGKLAAALGLADLPMRHMNFPLDGMFWSRSAVLQLLSRADAVEGQLRADRPDDRRHARLALRRLLPLLAGKAGLRVAVTHVAGMSRGWPDRGA